MAINFLDGITVDGNATFGTGNKFQTIVNALEGVGTNGVYLRSAISSAANPSFSNSDDTNTGMFLPGSDVLGLSTAGSERFRITSAGNVGIGTTSPDSKLELIGDYKQKAADGNTQGFTLSINPSTDAVSLNNFYNASMTFSTNNSANMTITGGGLVGIGTTAPTQKLTVAGVIKIDTSSDKQMQFVRTGGNTFSIEHDSSRMYFYNETSVNHTLTLLNGGNVGIGNTSPSTKLDVNGTFKATSVRSTGGGDGGFVLRQWTHASNYASLATNGMSGLEYCMISDGTNTFIGSGTSGTTRLRGPANDSSPQLEMTSTLCKIDSGDLKVEDGSIAVGTITNSTTNGRIDASNDIVAFSTSDIRLKDNIKSIDKALDKVNSIQGIEFDWIEKEEVHGNSGHDIGVIAQEIENILPDVVTTRDNGYKAVKYEKIVPLLIEAIKDLSKQVDGLKRLI